MGTHLRVPFAAIAACCGLLCACAAAPSPTPTPIPTPSVTASPSPTPTITPTATPAVFDIALPDIAQIPVVDKPLVVVPWGRGKCEVGLSGPNVNFRLRRGARGAFGPTSGPGAIDVSPDGIIALVDQAHNRLLLIDPSNGKCNPFVPDAQGIFDVAFDAQGRMALYTGPYSGATDPTIQLYLLV